MNRVILAFLWFVFTAVETDSIQNVATISEHDVTASHAADSSAEAVVGVAEAVVEKKSVDLEASLAKKGSPRRRRRRRDRRRRRRRRFRRRRRRRRRRRTPAPTPVPTPVPTAVPTPVPTPVPTVKAGKGKGGALFSDEESDYLDDVEPTSAVDAAAYFAKVHAHLQEKNSLEGDALEGDALLLICNGQAYEMDPSAGVKTPEVLATEWGRDLTDGDEATIASEALAKNPTINLVFSSPQISTINQFLTKATVPATGDLALYFAAALEPDELVRQMDATTAKQYGLSVEWLKGLDLASL